MKVTAEHESNTAQTLREKAARIRDVTPVDAEALRAAIDGNKDVNFDPNHRLSFSRVENGDLFIGTRSRSYGKLLKMPFEAVANVYRRYINDKDNG